MFFHQTYGLNIQSEFLLPELIKSDNQPDIYIQKAKVKLPTLETTTIQRQGKEAYFGGNTQEAYLRWEGVTTFLAKNGDTLIVNPDSDHINPQLLSLYILSEALGLILYQRGFFLLHASAVKIGEQVVIFAGPPGAGKSTTAAAFAKCGYTVLADDMVAIKLDATGKAMVVPGFPQIKIWPSTARGLDYNLSALPTLFPGSRKRVIRQIENFPVKHFPLTHMFILGEGENLKITPMEGTEAFFNLTRFFPLPSSILQGNARERHLQECIQLLREVDIWQLENPQNFQTIKQVVNGVEKKLNINQNQHKVLA
ncbi:hypothetical protein ACP6PL_11305 [Dapis sp. BLCC M126]|uniref:hypothetical protein n=1 Tax=Dapis sp. BLCC M126 TaxID=3400189 RepID=UPI003CFAE246